MISLFLSLEKLLNQTLESAFLERIRKVQNSKYETDLLKIVDCFIDGYGPVNSSVSNFLLIVEYLFIKILSKLFLFKSKVFSTNKFAIFNTCAKINSQEDFFRKKQILQKLNLTFLQDAKTVLVFQQVCKNVQQIFVLDASFFVVF